MLDLICQKRKKDEHLPKIVNKTVLYESNLSNLWLQKAKQQNISRKQIEQDLGFHNRQNLTNRLKSLNDASIRMFQEYFHVSNDELQAYIEKHFKHKLLKPLKTKEQYTDLQKFWIQKINEKSLDKEAVNKKLGRNDKNIYTILRAKRPKTLHLLADMVDVTLADINKIDATLVPEYPKTISEYYLKLQYDNYCTRKQLENVVSMNNASIEKKLTTKQARKIFDYLEVVNLKELSKFMKQPVIQEPMSKKDYLYNIVFITKNTPTEVNNLYSKLDLTELISEYEKMKQLYPETYEKMLKAW